MQQSPHRRGQPSAPYEHSSCTVSEMMMMDSPETMLFTMLAALHASLQCWCSARAPRMTERRLDSLKKQQDRLIGADEIMRVQIDTCGESWYASIFLWQVQLWRRCHCLSLISHWTPFSLSPVTEEAQSDTLEWFGQKSDRMLYSRPCIYVSVCRPELSSRPDTDVETGKWSNHAKGDLEAPVPTYRDQQALDGVPTLLWI